MQCDYQTATLDTPSSLPHLLVPLPNESLDILLVEDIASDAMLTRLALDATEIPYHLHTLRKGSEVLPRLWEHRNAGRGNLPDLMILDLGLPELDGFEILAGIMAAPASIRAVPIVILTGHEHFSYLQKTYDLWIAAYLPKPCNALKIREVMMRIYREKRVATQF